MIAAHAKLMSTYGVNMVFGPLQDVAPATADSPLGDRVFSADPMVVDAYSKAYLKGWNEGGILPTVKHFPGLGAATGNTDFTIATTAPISELRKRDLLPYTGISRSTTAVMVGNQIVPGLSGGRPASLSSAVVKGELRDRFGFDGLVITDSLNAAAIRPALSDAVVQAIEAGNDMALIVDPPVGRTWEPVLAEIERKLELTIANGSLTPAQLNKSVSRIFKAKHINPCSLKK